MGRKKAINQSKQPNRPLMHQSALTFTNKGFETESLFQMDDLLLENQQFDVKRCDVEAWLSRMESWLSRMRPVGMSPELLETQIHEQKVTLKKQISLGMTLRVFANEFFLNAVFAKIFGKIFNF